MAKMLLQGCKCNTRGGYSFVMVQEEDFAIQLGERLTKSRKSKGFKNRKNLTANVGIHLSTYGNYEQGKRMPDAVFLKHFCVIMQVNHIWLFTGQGAKTLPDSETGLDIALLKKIVKRVEEFLEQTRSRLTPDQKAGVVSILYEELLEKPQRQPEIIDTKTKHFIKLLAG